MNEAIFKNEIQEYIKSIENFNAFVFHLKKSPFENISSKELSQQIQGRQIAKNKIPFLLSIKNYYYPTHLNLEQASSEFTAIYKQSLGLGESFLDLTGGMGIDTYFIGKNFKSITYVEKNQELFEISKHNLNVLFQDKNLDFINTSAEYFIENNKKHFDLIYIDPSRRINGSRKFLLEELEPNIISLKDDMLKVSNKILIKLSSLFDIKECIKKIDNVTEIHIISYKNEVKELLIILENTTNPNPKIIAIDLFYNQQFQYNYIDEEMAIKPNYSLSEKYIYIPNNSLLKAGCFKLISFQFQLNKLHPNTHIYSSNNLIDDFFGRIFEIVEYNINKKKLKGIKANVISKNYPLDTNEIKKKYKIVDGGDAYYFFIKAEEKYQILKCIRIK